MQESVAPTFRLKLSDEEVEERISIYGGDGSFARDLTYVLDQAGEPLAAAERLFWISELNDRDEAAVGRFLVMTGAPDIAGIAAVFTTNSLKRLEPPIDRTWIARIAREAQVVASQWTLPLRLLLRAKLSDVRRCAVTEAFADRPEEIARVMRTLQTYAMMETDIISVEMTAMERERATAIRHELSSEFESNVHDIVTDVAAHSQALQQRSNETARSVLGVLDKTSDVATASEQSAEAMRDAAHRASGLIQAIERARGEVETAADIATHASRQAADALTTSQALSDHAEAIESILGLIRNIAGQTNLLALNATIEAARAGDAGRGFAVVAQEVKSLASQTARAIDEVAVQIAAIQSATREAVEANASIRDTVVNVQASAQGIRAAMQEQARTVVHITESVDETAQAAKAMSSTVSAIRSATESIAAEIEQLASGLSDVSGRVGQMREKANVFAAKVAA